MKNKTRQMFCWEKPNRQYCQISKKHQKRNKENYHLVCSETIQEVQRRRGMEASGLKTSDKRNQKSRECRERTKMNS